jgi:hypothetical protein
MFLLFKYRNYYIANYECLKFHDIIMSLRRQFNSGPFKVISGFFEVKNILCTKAVINLLLSAPLSIYYANLLTQ